MNINIVIGWTFASGAVLGGGMTFMVWAILTELCKRALGMVS